MADKLFQLNLIHFFIRDAVTVYIGVLILNLIEVFVKQFSVNARLPTNPIASYMVTKAYITAKANKGELTPSTRAREMVSAHTMEECALGIPPAPHRRSIFSFWKVQG